MLVGRDSVMLALQRSVAGGESGVVTGPRGVGRTAVLEELVAVQPGKVLWIRGNEAVDGTPMAPFAPILAEHGADLSDTLRIYTEFTLTLAAANSLLVVDDLGSLDRGSAVLVAQLHRAGMTVIGSAISPSVLPDGLKEIARRWQVVDLAPLESADIAEIAEADLRAQLLAPSLARLLPVVAGRPGVLVAILDEARARGLLTSTAGGVRLGELPVPDEAVLAAGIDLAHLESRCDIFDVLAAGGDLPESLFDQHDVTDLARRGLLRADGEIACLDDPLLRAWSLYRLSPELRRRTMLHTAQRLRTLNPMDPHATVLESCALGSGAVTDAARWLFDQGRVAEAEGLVGRPGANSAGNPFEHALLRADIHLDLGSVDQATDALEEAGRFLGTGVRADVLMERWVTLLGGRAEDEHQLRDRVNAILEQIHDTGTRDAVHAAWRRRQVIVGFRGPAAYLESSHDDPVVVALRESMTGSLATAREVSAPSTAGQLGEQVDLEEQFRVLAHFLSLVYDGRLVEGREIAERHHRIAFDQGRPTLGLWTYNLAKIAFHAGQYDTAATRAAEARRHLAWRDVAGQALPAEAMLAAALARLGRLEQGERIAAALTEEDRVLPRVRIGVARVEAEVLRSRGLHREAADTLASAGQYAVTQDEAHSGLLAVDEAFMIWPDPAIADLLVSLRDKSALVAAFADRAVAVQHQDPEALHEAATRFEAMIQPGRAAHAWSAAARCYDTTRRPEQSRRARQNAVRVSTQWQVTPWPTERPEDTVLTAREYEIAIRAAGRQRSREIATALDLSVRTVDNHLARTYRKLGITGRDELAAALELPA